MVQSRRFTEVVTGQRAELSPLIAIEIPDSNRRQRIWRFLESVGAAITRYTVWAASAPNRARPDLHVKDTVGSYPVCANCPRASRSTGQAS